VAPAVWMGLSVSAWFGKALGKCKAGSKADGRIRGVESTIPRSFLQAMVARGVLFASERKSTVPSTLVATFGGRRQ
jgi:hypothetical protein